jgi:hypothetical protein
MASKKSSKKKVSKKTPSKAGSGRPANSKDDWTTMYIPKEPLQDLVSELQKLLMAESPYDVQIPRYTVLEIALREAIESRR